MNYSQLDYDEVRTLRAIGAGRFTVDDVSAVSNLPALFELSFAGLVRLTVHGSRIVEVALTPSGVHWLHKAGPGPDDSR